MRGFAGVFVSVALLAAACGGSGGDTVTGSTSPPTISTVPSELAPYCEAVYGVWILMYSGVTTALGLPAGEVEPFTVTRAEELRLVMQTAVAEGPEAVQQNLAVLAGAFDTMATNGDIRTLDAPEVAEARRSLNAFNADNCGWPVISISAPGRSKLIGVPQQLGPGFHSFQIRNDAQTEIVVDLYQVTGQDSVAIADRFPVDTPVSPPGVTFQGRVVLAPGATGPIVVTLAIGEWTFVGVDPSTQGLGPRIFVKDTLTPFRVVEGG